MSHTKDRTEDVLKILDSLGVEAKANEAMSSGQASFGDEFVPEDLGTEIVESARNFPSLLGAMPTENVFDMPTNPYKWPVEGDDPVFYHTPEQTDDPADEVTTSKAGTSDMTFSAEKLSASVFLSGELDDDARIAGGIKDYVVKKLGKAYSETVDKLILMGDTATGATGNVNKDDGTPAAGSYYLAQDGMVKSAVGDSLTLDVGGAMDAGDVLDLRALFAEEYGFDPSELPIIPTAATYLKMVQLSQVETVEKFGENATIKNGILTHFYGHPIIRVKGFGNAEADGKVSATGSNNTKGRMVMPYLPAWYVGFKRRIKIGIEYLPRKDQYSITAHVRTAVSKPRTGMSTMARNITV